MIEEVLVAVPLKVIPPADSARVFVDVASYNSQVYYVQGDVGVPGRLAFTGRENGPRRPELCGRVHPLGRAGRHPPLSPARGGKPAKDYKVDFDAIRKGVATANYQMFPGDRLVVGRNPIVAKTVEVDRAGSLINSLMNSILQYSVTARSTAVMNTPPLAVSGGAPQIKVNGRAFRLPTRPRWPPPSATP